MTVKFPLARPILAAALILGISAALAWLGPAYIGNDTAHRAHGVLLGGVVILYANAIPKMLTARSRLRCAPAQDQAARRFAGWSLVLGGLGYMLASLLAPLDKSSMIGGALLATALLAAAVRCLRIGSAGTRT